tara:strand:+ start:442 stop:1317 length:876 start_codon:yes stop_codon:yes gene_type:complete
MQEEAENLEIELELPEGEVDIREADVDDSLPDQKVELLTNAPKDELDTISEGVQKRIDKLTYKMREAERQRDEAVNYAQSIHTDNSSLRDKLKSSDSSLFKEYDNRIQSDLERAKIHLKEANEQGDGDAIATATEQLSRSAAEHENLRRLSAQQKVRESSNENQIEVPEAPVQQSAPPPDPKAQEWANKNEWFGSDQAMTYAAFGIHKELVEEGVDPSTDGYYSKVDGRMKEYFPNKFSEEQNAPVQQVAASSRGATGKRTARKVKLTPSQVAIAKRLNVPLEEYAKHIEQ